MWWQTSEVASPGRLAWTRPPRPSRRSEVRCPHSSLGARAASPRPARHPHTPAVRLFLNGARDAAGQGLPGRLPGRARPRSLASAGTSRTPPPPPSGPGHPHPLSGHPQASGLKWPSSATRRALCRPAPRLGPGAPPSKKTDRQTEGPDRIAPHALRAAVRQAPCLRAGPQALGSHPCPLVLER